MMPIKRLSLTDFCAKIPRGAREKTLRTALERDEVMKKWSETSWAKKIKAKEVRANLTDFERFKLMVARRKRATEVKSVMKKTKK